MFIYTSYFVTQTVKEMSNTGSGSDAINVFCASAQTFLSEIGIFIVSAVEYLEHWYSLVPLPWFVLKAQEVFPPVLLDHHCKHHCVWRTHIISYYYNENSFDLSNPLKRPCGLPEVYRPLFEQSLSIYLLWNFLRALSKGVALPSSI